jgi:catechol 2,3-dioxygenase-like lactoylglutathione lyase family enzyme
MGVRAVSHVAVGVRSMGRSLPFYRDVLGLPVAADQEESFGEFGGRRHAVYLRWGAEADASFVVLDEQLERSQEGEPAALFTIGVHHFGFWVDDVEAIAARARDAGVELVVEPSIGDTWLYGEPAGGKVKTAFLRDPDGNIVQVDERLRSDRG